MVKPALLEHCLFVWISLRRSAAEKYIPLLPLAGLLPALKCLASLEPQGKSAGEGDSALCPPEVLGIRHVAVPGRTVLPGEDAPCWGHRALRVLPLLPRLFSAKMTRAEFLHTTKPVPASPFGYKLALGAASLRCFSMQAVLCVPGYNLLNFPISQ